MRGQTVLLVEDSGLQRAVVADFLGRIGYGVVQAAGGHDALHLLGERRPDIVLLDVVMPELDGWQTLELIREVSGVPVIMLTAETTEEDRVRGLRAGADDYLGKPFGQDELAARIEAVLRRSGEARLDALTGLPNKRAFDEHLDTLLRAGAPAGRELSLVLFDLVHFKQINDTEGHPAGDQVLRDLARIAQRQVRLGEEIFRVGGEEFAIVIEASPEVGVLVADRVRGALAENRRSRLLPTLSAGVAGYPQDAGSKESLLAAADDALYAAKRGGRDAVALYSAAGAAAQMIER